MDAFDQTDVLCKAANIYMCARSMGSEPDGMTEEQMYAFLSYFDTKNLATRIHCAVLATSGLKDGTCPPHTNIAPYNLIDNTQSEYHFYPEMTHDYPRNWYSMIEEFRKKFL